MAVCGGRRGGWRMTPMAAGSILSTPLSTSCMQEVKTKKRYGRLQKAMGDHCLLAGSPRDALDHFNVAADLCRVVGDWVFQAGALEGQASAKVRGLDGRRGGERWDVCVSGLRGMLAPEGRLPLRGQSASCSLTDGSWVPRWRDAWGGPHAIDTPSPHPSLHRRRWRRRWTRGGTR